MSFLDMQDLALAVAQSGLESLFSSWCPDLDSLVDALEAGAGACLLTLAVRPRAKR